MLQRVVCGLAVVLLLAGTAVCQEGAKESLEQRIQKNPNDTKLLNEFFGQQFRAIYMAGQNDPDRGDKMLDAFEKSLAKIQPEQPAAKAFLSRAESTIKAYRARFALARIPLSEIVKALENNPADQESLSKYTSKVLRSISSIVRSEPDKATQQIADARKVVKSIREKTKDDESIAKSIESIERSLERYEQTVEATRKLFALIGQDAAPLQAAAWVNGKPLAQSDLKGKVVLIDFWAVWCGPCIATFPHLREWYEQYSDKGLVMIGVCRLEGRYTWDDANARIKRSEEGKVSEEDELSMLKKFAEHHDLHHVLAVQKDRTLSESYGVTVIPEVVVIDRSGKIQLIKVGSSPDNAKAIHATIEKLLAE